MNNNLGRFRIAATLAPEPAADAVPARVREILAVPREQRSPAQAEAVFGYFRTTVPEWKAHNDRIEALWSRWPAGSTALTLMARQEDRPTYLLQRGDWLKPVKQVTPGVPAFLHALPPDSPPSRLTFARWLADRRSPTTARVFVNRVWQAYFGTGLVGTPEDFGVQSQSPSHPELLDWLAVEFMDSGWSVKHLHRLIVTSATYRQSSRVTEELLARDPHNRLLARGPRFRLEGEIVRDDALAEARRRREESDSSRPERMRRAGELPDLDAVTEMAQKKADVQGTFSALAVRGLGATSLAERTAKATEQVAANTKKLLDKAKEGGLVFA